MTDQSDGSDDSSDGPFDVDRRRDRRVPLDASVTIRKTTAEDSHAPGLSEQAEFTVEGRGEDISVGGMYLIAEERLAAGSSVEVEFELADFDATFDLPAQVRWTRRLPSPDGDHDWAVGLQFDDIEPGDERQLDEFVLERLMDE